MVRVGDLKSPSFGITHFSELIAVAVVPTVNDTFILPDNVQPGPLIHPERHDHVSLTEDEVNRIIRDCRSVYTTYRSKGEILLSCVPVLTATVLILGDIAISLFTNHELVRGDSILFFVLLVQPICVQAYMMSLIYLDRVSLLRWIGKLARFVLCSFFFSFRPRASCS